MRCIILTAQQAQAVRGKTAAWAELDPRLIDAGPHMGKYALPERVLLDAAHASRKAALLARQVVDLNTAEAWPA